ncbi:MAG: 5-(carboxyamino)imidazole ribonucleotide synthase [Crocinitomicaceae bacterium]|nr:5-(carboxyamino)imidazole ribonucleotide synthase [Crocinitomicaceae bacterium]
MENSKKVWYGKGFKLGVLGGGQLGRMLIQEAIDWNVHIYCLDPDPNAPCSQIANNFTIGSITDYQTVLDFAKDKDVVTVEIENVNIEALEEVEKMGVKVFPQPNVLRIIRDKGIQKEFYKKHGLPTSDFSLINSKAELSSFDNFFPKVQKLRTGGYDGRGVKVLKSQKDIKDAFDAPCILEDYIPFEKELAIIVARNESGDVNTFPVVECEFSPEANLVEFLFSPAEISKMIESKAKEIAINIIESLQMVGILAVEFFLTKDGDLLINEIAPRPHNSGHHTIECNVTSQFQQHLRSVLNLPLGDSSLINCGAMLNILGEKGSNGPALYDGMEFLLNHPGVFVHVYGKEMVKPFRKMGHVTLTAPTILELKQKVKFIKGKLKAHSA